MDFCRERSGRTQPIRFRGPSPSSLKERGLRRMGTTTKKQMIDRVAEETNQRRTVVKQTIQCFLDNVIRELGEGNRLEFRDFGVFEIRKRAPRVAQNPKTLERVTVPEKTTVKFKVGRLMKSVLDGEIDDEDQADDLEIGRAHV